MVNNYVEKRKYTRMYFSIADGLVGSFTLPGLEKEIISGSIMDLSEGGLCLSFTKNLNVAILEGGKLILQKIKGTKSFRNLNDIEVVVRWIIEFDDSKNITFGCQFMNITEDDRKKIREFINSWEVS